MTFVRSCAKSDRGSLSCLRSARAQRTTSVSTVLSLEADDTREQARETGFAQPASCGISVAWQTPNKRDGP